jgi:peptidoglycan/LPS O-acetylase OafA/YrhL
MIAAKDRFSHLSPQASVDPYSQDTGGEWMSFANGGQSTVPPWALTYRPALDGLRAIAALSVVAFHLRLPGFAGGGLGVDMFFTLSGFLITALIIREISARGTLSFRAFYARRALRLLPAYLAVLITCVLADLFVVDAGGTLKGAFFSFFYVANWAVGLRDMGLGTLAHTWSLSIEEQFYLGWPALTLLAFWLAQRWRVSVLAFVSVMCAFSWGLTAVFVFGVGVSFSLLNNATPFRATELMAGCVLAAVAARGGFRWLMTSRMVSTGIGLLSLLGLVALIVAGHADTNAQLFGLWILVSLCTAGLIASTQTPRTPAGRILSVRPIVQVGKMSYGLYLWHFPILVSIDALVGLDSLWARVVAAGMTAAIVALSYYMLEQPFLRLKARVQVVKTADQDTVTLTQSFRTRNEPESHRGRPSLTTQGTSIGK